MKISQEGTAVNDEKVAPLLAMLHPKKSKELAKFEGMCFWFRKHIPHFSEICEPLYQLNRKRAKFVWSPTAQNAFEKLKTPLTSSAVFVHPTYSKTFELTTDASSIGIGASLCQNGRPFAYASRILISAERNYPSIKR